MLRKEQKAILTELRGRGMGKAKRPKPTLAEDAFGVGVTQVNDEFGFAPVGAVNKPASAAFDIYDLIGHTNSEISQEIRRFYKRVADEAIDLTSAWAGAMVDADAVKRRVGSLLKEHIPEALKWIRRGQADQMDQIFQLIAGDGSVSDQRGIQKLIANVYNTAYLRAEGVARTEMAWAYESYAAQSFIDMGVEVLKWDFGGGPCTTGVCFNLHGMMVRTEEYNDLGFGPFPAAAAGGDFVGIIHQPPAHPSCTCVLVPSDLEEYDAAPEELRIGAPSAHEAFYDLNGELPEQAAIRADADSGLTLHSDLGGGMSASYVYRSSSGQKYAVKPKSGWPRGMRHDIPDGNDGAREAVAFVINREMGDIVDLPPTIFHGDVDGQPAILMSFVDSEGNVKNGFLAGALRQDGVTRWGFDSSDFSDEEIHRLALFDAVIANEDRHYGNALWTTNSDGSKHLIAIDHGLAFPSGDMLDNDPYASTWGENMGAVVADVTRTGGSLTASDDQRLLGLLFRRTKVTEALSRQGLEDDAIEEMFKRVEWMLAEGRIPSPIEFEARPWG